MVMISSSISWNKKIMYFSRLEDNLMQDDDYVSADELVWKANQDFESLVKRQDMDELWEHFCRNPKIINAKRLWIYFTAMGQRSPQKVEEMMLIEIKKQVGSSNLARPIKNTFERDQLFGLLHSAKTNLIYFWRLLHCPHELSFGFIDAGNKDILDKLRKFLPEPRKFETGELYAIFYELSIGNDEPPIGPPYLYEDGFAQAFRDWRDRNIIK